MRFAESACPVVFSSPAAPFAVRLLRMLEPGALTTVIDTLWLEHIRQGGTISVRAFFVWFVPTKAVAATLPIPAV